MSKIKNLVFYLQRFLIVAVILGGIYGLVVVVPYMVNNRPPEDPAVTSVRNLATETLVLFSSLQSIEGDAPSDAHNLVTLVNDFKSHADNLKEVETSGLDSEAKQILGDVVNVFDRFIDKNLVVADQFAKVLAYYPETDLYGSSVSSETSLERADEAARNLRSLSVGTQGTSLEAPFQKAVSCFESLNQYQEGACLPQFANLRGAIINFLAQEATSYNANELKNLLQKLLSQLQV